MVRGVMKNEYVVLVLCGRLRVVRVVRVVRFVRVVRVVRVVRIA